MGFSMRCAFTRLAVSASLAFLPFLATPFAGAQTAAAVQRSARVLTAVDAGQKVRLSNHVPVFADTSQLPSTALSSSGPFSDLRL